MRILEPLVRRSGPQTEQRFGSFGFGGIQYPYSWAGGSRPEFPDAGFQGVIDSVHRRNGVVSAAVHTRALLMSQLRFAWRRVSDGAHFSETSTDRRLAQLNRPAGSTRSELLYRLELDASYSGTAFVARTGPGLVRLAPDHVSFVLGSNSDPTYEGEAIRMPADAQVIGIVHHDNRGGSGRATVFGPGEYAAWSPEPDPVHWWRGASWVTSVVREIVGDTQATDHVQRFFEHAATPNLVFTMDPSKTPEQVKAYADVVNEKHTGAMNSFKNMFLGGATDVKVVGSALDTLNLKDLTGGFENRVAIRSRIPAVILGAREGLSGSSLNAGNYASARRLLADGWFAPSAQGLCAALEKLVDPPSGSELWYDADEVLFLQEDQMDAAEIVRTQANSIRTLSDGGFDPDSVVSAIATGDLSKLVHTGRPSVQLQSTPTEGGVDD